MRFSLRFNNDRPARDYPVLARAAEAAGFDQFWVSDDLFLRSAPVLLTAVALATERIHIGTCIVNPYTLHPAEMAMMAATLDEVSGGRFLLGLSSGAAEFLKWVGIAQDKPRTAVVETIRGLRRLFAGEAVSSDGAYLRWTDEAYLRFPPSRPIPIYLGALSPNMLEAIGAEADGGLPLLLPPEHYDTVLPLIQAGAAKAGRSLDDLDLAACIWVSIGDDRAAAEDALREKIAYYGHAMSPLIWERMGVARADFDPIERAMMTERDPDKAKRLVTPAMLSIGLAGTAADVLPRLQGLAERGVRHLSFGPPLGPDLLAAIEMIGRDILPHFRGALMDFELYDLRVTVTAIEGRSVCGLKVGDWFEVTESNRLRLPPGQHFCIYALASVLPLLAARQRALDPADWMASDTLVACPDPDERLIMQIQRIARRALNRDDLT